MNEALICTNKHVIASKITKTHFKSTTRQVKPITLSKRQIECIALLMKGMSAKDTARILNLSPRTIEDYLIAARNKLYCANQAELIMRCLKEYKELFHPICKLL